MMAKKLHFLIPFAFTQRCGAFPGSLFHLGPQGRVNDLVSHNDEYAKYFVDKVTRISWFGYQLLVCTDPTDIALVVAFYVLRNTFRSLPADKVENILEQVRGAFHMLSVLFVSDCYCRCSASLMLTRSAAYFELISVPCRSDLLVCTLFSVLSS